MKSNPPRNLPRRSFSKAGLPHNLPRPSPSPPSSSLPSLPCAGAQGLESSRLDNARKLLSKFTVADPFVTIDKLIHAAPLDANACWRVCKSYDIPASCQGTTLLHHQKRSRSTLYLSLLSLNGTLHTVLSIHTKYPINNAMIPTAPIIASPPALCPPGARSCSASSATTPRG